nr:hypothetical protein GW17_00019753 [Ipomoea batatas]GMD81803.1 hypothetical protein GW17_00019753 [Ipomoea batatas]
MKIIQTVKQLPQQGLNGVVIDWLVDLVSMMSYYFLKVMLCIVKSKVQRHICRVDVNIHQFYNILMGYLPEQLHNFDGGGGDPVSVLGLLELLDCNRFVAVGFDLRQEHQSVRSFPDLPEKIVVLQPLRPIPRISTTSSTAVSHLCRIS